MKPQEICSRNTLVHEPQPQVQSPHGDESMEVELLRLSGPPRFLFTIKEETKEDLESSEDGKSKSRKGSRTRSLSDVLETPFLTPIASPPYFTPPLTPLINPFFESTTDFEFSSKPSPPPTFKFLRDAEEKLHRSRTMEEKAQRLVKKKEAFDASSSHVPDKELAQISPPLLSAQENVNVVSHYPSSSSQVLPLATSPPAPHSPLSRLRPLHTRSFTR
nr:uncharacterized protein LOC109187179 [Ipomoea batatas]